MKHKLLLFACLLLSVKIIAQEATYKIGTPFQKLLSFTPNFELSGDICFDSIGNLINVKCMNKTFIVQKYSTKEMKEVSRTIFTNSSKNFTFLKTLKLNNRYFYIYSIKNRKNESIYLRELNLETCNFKDSVLLFNSKYKVNHNKQLYYNYLKNDYNIQFSADSSKILISYDKLQYTIETYNKDIIDLFVFDLNFKLLTNNEIELPYTNNEISRLGSLISNNGQFYQLIFKHDSLKLKLLKYDTQSKVKIYDFNFKDTISFVDFKLIEQKNGNIIGASFYQKGTEYFWDENKEILLLGNGIINIEFDVNGNLVNYSLKDFNLLNIPNGVNFKGMKSVDFYQFNNKFILTGEPSFYNEYIIQNKVYYEYFYGKVIEYVFDLNFKKIYQNLIIKNQQSYKNNSEMGIKSFQTQNGKITFYVEDKEDSNVIQSALPMLYENNRYLYVNVTDINANSTKNISIFNINELDNSNLKTQLRKKLLIRNIHKESDNRYYLEVDNEGGEQNFIKIEIN